MDKESQCKLILVYMKERGSITAQEAMKLCGCMRLAARIHDLRRKGIGITTEKSEYKNRAGNRVSYAIYKLEVKNA